MRTHDMRLWVATLLIFTCSAAGQSIDSLKQQADAILARNTIMARPDVGVVFQAADALSDAGRLAEADHYYLGALTIEPHDFDHHLRYAQLLDKEEKQPEENIQTGIIVNGCEAQVLVAKAMDLMGVPPFQTPPFQSERPAAVRLVLVPIGDVDLYLLQQEQKKLQDELGIDVQIQSLPVTVRAAARDPMHDEVQTLRRQLQQAQSKDPALFSKILSDAGMSNADLSNDSNVIHLTARIIRAGGQEEQADEIEKMADQADPQWSADDMLADLWAATPKTTSRRIRIVGVTGNDIFMNGTNYVFGIDNGAIAIVSYHRFTANFNSEIPSRVRLLHRLHCQCLASAGHVFGLPRCTDPMCPLCYPDDIEEMDAKSEKVSETCLVKFKAAFAAVSAAP